MVDLIFADAKGAQTAVVLGARVMLRFDSLFYESGASRGRRVWRSRSPRESPPPRWLFPPPPSGDSHSLPAPRSEPHELDPRVVTEILRVTVFVWKTLCAALLPIALRHVAEALPRFLDHLGRSNEHCRIRRIDTFRETIDTYAASAAS